MNTTSVWIIFIIIILIIVLLVIISNNQKPPVPQAILAATAATAATSDLTSITLDENGFVIFPGQQPIHLTTITTQSISPSFMPNTARVVAPNIQPIPGNVAVSCNCPSTASVVVASPMQVVRGNIITGKQYLIVGYIYLCAASTDPSVYLTSGTTCLCNYAFNSNASQQDKQNFTNLINSLITQGRIKSTCNA